MPVGAGPDESAHIIKAAAVVRGEFIGEPTDDPSKTRVAVPAVLADANAWNCFAYQPEVSAACQKPFSDEAGATVATTTTAGLYNPLYYLLVGAPSLLPIGPVAMVMGMRLLTALVSAALLAGIFGVLGTMVSRALALAVVGVTMTPMVFFLSAIVNPNSLEILGGAAFLVGLLWFATTPSAVRSRAALGPGILLAAGGALGANARGVSPFWMFVAGLLFLLLLPKPGMLELFRAPSFLAPLGAVVLGALFGVIWVLRTGTLQRMGDFPGQDLSPVAVFFRMILNAPSDPGLIALFGWVDTPAPGMVYAIYGFLIFGLVSGSLLLAEKRWRRGILSAIAVFFAVPALLQAMALKSSGFIWQGRYSLVALVMLLIISALALALRGRNSRGTQLSGGLLRRYTGMVLALVIVAQFWAFFSNLQRYSVGQGSPIEVFFSPAWSPGIGAPGVCTIYFLGVMLLLAAWISVLREPRWRGSISEMCGQEYSLELPALRGAGRR